jgi:hypothetical protein
MCRFLYAGIDTTGDGVRDVRLTTAADWLDACGYVPGVAGQTLPEAACSTDCAAMLLQWEGSCGNSVLAALGETQEAEQVRDGTLSLFVHNEDHR